MAQYNFEGDISGISELQLEFINKVIIENGYKDGKVTFETVGKAGDNYSADVKRIIVEGENGSLSMVAKVAPTVEMARLATNTGLSFKNEHTMYTEVLPTFLDLQKNADVPESELLRFAKCYGSFTEAPHEIILLEDLKTSNYVMMDRFESLSDECVKSVLKNFGIYHSLSYVLKHKDMEKYNSLKCGLMSMWNVMESMDFISQHFGRMEDAAVAVLDNQEHKDAVKNKIKLSLQLNSKLSKLDENSKHSIIRQGDPWTNNIMFKFEEGELQSSIMIDYQLSNHGNPVYDLLYMIFNCTDHKTRAEHFYDWIDYYHSELDKSLSNFGLKASLVYPRDQLDADLKRYGILLFGLSVILASILTLKSEEASIVKESMKNVENMENFDLNAMYDVGAETAKLFKNRIIGLIDSFKMFGLM